MLTTEQTEAFARDGFLAGPVVLDDVQVGELRQELDRAISDQGRSGVAQPVRVANLDNDAHPVWQVVNKRPPPTGHRRPRHDRGDPPRRHGKRPSDAHLYHGGGRGLADRSRISLVYDGKPVP
jgi:hypothetical protein